MSACSNFQGLRTPLYDGEPFVANEESIEAYEDSREIVGEEKEYFLRYEMSQDIKESSLPFSDEEPVLLEEGEYIIGEDIPSGRVFLLGNQSYFQANEHQRVRIGNLIIRDQEDRVYFENHFHGAFGVLFTEVDFKEGHSVEIIGDRPEITAFYTEQMPENPYVLMELPEVIENTREMEELLPDRSPVQEGARLHSGIWEVGVHIEAGTYALTEFVAPREAEMYVFSQTEETPRVFALTNDLTSQLPLFENSQDLEDAFAEGRLTWEEYEREQMLLLAGEDSEVIIELQVGDTIYLSGTEQLLLENR